MTLIEVLITIVVFSVGILTILSIITGSLSLGSRSRNRTTATMLAKEGLEMMYNVRDTNLDKAQTRGCIPPVNTTCAFNIEGGSSLMKFIVDRDDTGIKVVLLNTFDDSRLHITTGNNITTYSHTGAGIPSPFYRYITIESAVGMLGDSDTINDNLKKITSTVEYPQLGGTGKIELESFIGLTR